MKSVVRWSRCIGGLLLLAQIGAPLHSSTRTDSGDEVRRIRIDQPIVVDLSGNFDAFNSPPAVTLVGPTGPIDASSTFDLQQHIVTVRPQQDLLPASTYTLFVSNPSSARIKVAPFISVSLATDPVSPSKSSPPWPSDGANPTNTAAADCDLSNSVRGFRFCSRAGKIDGGIFTPGSENTKGHWRLNKQLPALAGWSDVRPSNSNSTTTLYGVARRIDDQPLVGVTVSLGSRSAKTNGEGRFILQDIPSGHQVLWVDGSTANKADEEYGEFEAAVELKADQANNLGYDLFVPRISARDKVSVSSPTTTETVITHPAIPGLEIRIPAGAVFRNHAGKIITEIAIVPMPVDRSPIPVPANFPVYFSAQPGGTSVEGLSTSSTGLHIVYPNYLEDGSDASGFWYYDAEHAGWSVYTESELSADKTVLC